MTFDSSQGAMLHSGNGKNIIVTSSLQRFHLGMKIIIESRTKEAIMGAITGEPGLGKTTALLAFREAYGRRTHTHLPACICLRVKARSTARALAIDWLTAMGETPRGRNVYELEDEICDAIETNQPDIVVLDEGDLLDTDSFELVRYVFDITHCPIAVVGSPSIKHLLYQHDKFASRVGFRMQFLPLKEKEILETVLPQLAFTGWAFDPHNADHQAIGKQIWSWVQPSLRDLQHLLQNASIFAQKAGESMMTLPILQEAAEFMGAEENQRHRTQQAERYSLPEDTGTYESDSERRHEARGKRQPRQRGKGKEE